MALVVFLRGVNVGGRRTFQPSALARELADLDVVNVGAAGTFVVRKATSQAAVRAEFLGRLPVETELMVVRGGDLMALARGDPFAAEAAAEGADRCVSVLAKRPRALPGLPLRRPAGDSWQVQVVGAFGTLVLSLWRRVGTRLLYPNEVVEKQFGVPATTRNWNTVVSICELLEAGR